jgi:hypothetical protein
LQYVIVNYRCYTGTLTPSPSIFLEPTFTTGC